MWCLKLRVFGSVCTFREWFDELWLTERNQWKGMRSLFPFDDISRFDLVRLFSVEICSCACEISAIAFFRWLNSIYLTFFVTSNTYGRQLPRFWQPLEIFVRHPFAWHQSFASHLLTVLMPMLHQPSLKSRIFQRISQQEAERIQRRRHQTMPRWRVRRPR